MKKICAALFLLLLAPAFAQMPRWTATGSVTTSTSIVAVPSHDFGLATVTIHGTYAGVSVVFEFSDDSGVTWYQDQCVRSDASVMETGEAVATNASLEWDCGVAATTNFRVRATAYSTGTATVNITLTQDQIEPAVTASVLPTPTTAAAQGTSVCLLPANTTAASCKASAGNLYGFSIYNPNATLCVLQVFNTSSVTLGTTQEILDIPVLSTGGNNYAYIYPVNFSADLYVASTTAAHGASTCGTGMLVNLFYE